MYRYVVLVLALLRQSTLRTSRFSLVPVAVEFPKKFWRGSLLPVEICRTTYFNRKKSILFSKNFGYLLLILRTNLHETDVDIRQIHHEPT